MHAYPDIVHFQPRGNGAEAMLEKMFRPLLRTGSLAIMKDYGNSVVKVQLHKDAAT